MTTANTLYLPWSPTFVVAELPIKKPVDFLVTPNSAQRVQLAEYLGILELRKLEFDGTLQPSGTTDWHIDASLGATVVQSCVVTLAPVVTRIDENVLRKFVSDLPVEPQAGETEIPADDAIEPIGTEISIGRILSETLMLALPQFPRAPGAELAQTAFSEPGISPMSDQDARPFAQLKSLRDGLKNDTE